MSFGQYADDNVKKQKQPKLSVRREKVDTRVMTKNSAGKLVYQDLSSDEKTIIAKPISGVIISTNAGFEAGEVSMLLQVTKADDKSLVGEKIACEIIESRRSNISGAEGRLILRPLYIFTKDKRLIHLLPTDIHRRGKNFQCGKFWLSPLIIPIFVPGTGARIFPNEEFVLRLE